MNELGNKELDIAYHKVIAKEYNEVVVEPRSYANDLLFKPFETLVSGKNSLLDIGCGTGHMLVRYGSDKKDVVGIDHSFEMLQKAKDVLSESEINNCTLIETDIISFLTLNDKKYDLITMVGCLHHLPPEDFLQTLKLIKSKLSVEGKFLLAEPIEIDAVEPPQELLDWNSKSVAVGLTYSEHADDPDEAPIELNHLKTLAKNAGLELLAETRGTEIFPHQIPPSKEELETIKQLHEKYGPLGHVYAGLFS